MHLRSQRISGITFFNPRTNQLIIDRSTKPPRICEYDGCPLESYEGRKMRMCANCEGVRYCSSKCQRNDWETKHRRVCRTLPDDPGFQNWFNAHDWLVKWAVSQAYHPSKPHITPATHTLKINILRPDWPFSDLHICFEVGVVPHYHLDCGITTLNSLSPISSKEPKPRKDEDGYDIASVSLGLWPRTKEMTGIIYAFRLYPLRPDVIPRDTEYCPGWEAVVKLIANIVRTPDKLLSLVQPMRPLVPFTEDLHRDIVQHEATADDFLSDCL